MEDAAQIEQAEVSAVLLDQCVEPLAAAAPSMVAPSVRALKYRQGLRKLAPDLLAKARDDTTTQITRILLTFVSLALFCALALSTPDSALLVGGEKLNVPLAGPVSFFGFVILGPLVLIALRIYLQVYIDHERRIYKISRCLPSERAPTLIPTQNWGLRRFNAFAFYWILPVSCLLFFWKAAVFPICGGGLLCVAAIVIAMHLTLIFARFSWRLRAAISLCAGIIAVGLIAVFGFPHRPFSLVRANLSGQWLVGSDLSGADMTGASLDGAYLDRASLNGASLIGVSMNGARLGNAELNGANLAYADLSGTILTGVDLSGASLSDVRNLTQEQLDTACGTAVNNLAPPLTFNAKPCPQRLE